MKKIFVVEDDGSICDELVQILENEGYEAESLKNFATKIKLVAKN